jgi:hypothetical protein
MKPFIKLIDNYTRIRRAERDETNTPDLTATEERLQKQKLQKQWHYLSEVMPSLY